MNETNINVDNNTPNILDPRSYAARMADKDSLNLGREMHKEDKDRFKAAMRKEVNDLHSANVWEIVPNSIVTQDAKLIPLI